MAGLHDRILKTLAAAGAAGLTVDELQKRLHPVFPPAVEGGVKRLASQGRVRELGEGRYAAPEGEGGETDEATPEPARSTVQARRGEGPGARGGGPNRGARPGRPGAGRREGTGRREELAGKSTISLRGRLVKHRDGFGFVTPEDQTWTKDVFVPRGLLGGALPGDRVEVALEEGAAPTDSRYKGEIVQVLERTRTHMTGFLEKIERNRYLVMPTDPAVGDPIEISSAKIHGAGHGKVVLVELAGLAKDGRLRGEVVEVLGEEGDPALDTAILIAENGIRTEWPEPVLKAAEDIPEEVPEADLREGRLDLRDQPCFTIDGKDARDLDDAVYLEAAPKGGVRLWVHIADVSHYVRPGDVIDQEAIQRGTSVYFPDRVIPMLPQALSNGICSLHPEVDRLTLTARMDFDKAGKRKGFQLLSTVIRSQRRLNYDEVHAACIEKDAEARTRLAPVLPVLERMFQLADAMRARRAEAGYIDFDLPAVKVKVDAVGNPVDIVPDKGNLAYGLIEQFMVAANEAVSDWMVAQKRDFVFRVHGTPDVKKLAQLAETARSFGVKPDALTGADPAHGLQGFLKKIEGLPEEGILRVLTLRCMQLAEYSHLHKGHFGLGSEAYTHFTSPIRRYPDLIVHRLLKDQAGMLRLGKKAKKELVEELPALTRECSRLERQAEQAEREAIRLKKAHYLSERMDEVRRGTITNVAKFGLFVELEDILSEVLIHISKIGNEYFHHDEERRELVGAETGTTYRLGDTVHVKVTEVNLRERRVMAELAEGPRAEKLQRDRERLGREPRGAGQGRGGRGKPPRGSRGPAGKPDGGGRGGEGTKDKKPARTPSGTTQSRGSSGRKRRGR